MCVVAFKMVRIFWANTTPNLDIEPRFFFFPEKKGHKKEENSEKKALDCNYAHGRGSLKQTAIIHTPETEGPQTLIFEAEENFFKV